MGNVEQKASTYIPYAFRSFQGYSVIDIKESIVSQKMEIVLEKQDGHTCLCNRCGHKLGAMKDRYWVRARHLRVFNWHVTVAFWREKRWCPNCQKVRSEVIDFICPTSPHMTMELAWWVSRLSEITSVLQVSKLESVDKMACYEVDHHILRLLFQSYEIPKVTHIGVDEVYARGPKQLKNGETRDDLFFTVIVDLITHKVIWVSKSRRKGALDEFLKILGPEACKDIKVVATDQHEGYSASVTEHCPNAVVVLDRFHLVQNFNEALNEDRKEELDIIDPEGEMGDLMNGKYRYLFLTKSKNRSQADQKHIAHVTKLNKKMAQLEIIKEHFHRIFDAPTKLDAQVMLAEIYQWSMDCGAHNVFKWIVNILKDMRFWNYFEQRFNSGVVEGINRAIKGLKWQAYGYKNMAYFALKILQKCGYLNHRYALKFREPEACT
jgi:transposase